MSDSDKSTLHDLLAAVRARLQALTVSANVITDLTVRLKLRQQITGLEKALDAATSLHEVPLELCHAMRAPADTIQVIRLSVADRTTRIVINPLGRADAEREVTAWRDITAAVSACQVAGETLQRMDRAVAVVEVDDTALVVNAAHSRTVVRGALRILRHSAAFSVSLVWIKERVREHPKYAALALGAVSVVAAVGIIVSLSSSPRPLEEVWSAPELTASLPTTPSPTSPSGGPTLAEPASPEHGPATPDRSASADPGRPTLRPTPEGEPSPSGPRPTPTPDLEESPAEPPVEATQEQADADSTAEPTALPSADPLGGSTASPTPTAPVPAPSSDSPPPATAAHCGEGLGVDLHLPAVHVDVCL